MDVEFEHGSHDPQTDVTRDDPIVTGKIALAHMKEFPDYYERLERMEREAEARVVATACVAGSDQPEIQAVGRREALDLVLCEGASTAPAAQEGIRVSSASL